jgi:hypothetical protein
MDVAAFVISICGFLLGVLSLWVSLRSARAGERSATAAEKSAVAAKQTLRESRRSNDVTAEMLEIERHRYASETSTAQKVRMRQQTDLFPELELSFVEAQYLNRTATQAVLTRSALGSLFSSNRKRVRYRAALEITNLGSHIIDRLVVSTGRADWTFNGNARHTCERLRPADTIRVPLLVPPSDDADMTFTVVTTTYGVEHKLEKRLAWKFHKHAFVASLDE